MSSTVFFRIGLVSKAILTASSTLRTSGLDSADPWTGFRTRSPARTRLENNVFFMGLSFFRGLRTTQYSTGITSTINVSGRSGNAPSTTSVSVDIRHTYSGDLIVDLIAPDGSVYNLQNRSGGSADNIVKTFTVNLSTETINGTWKLRARDRAASDTGYINSWSITM